MEQEVHSLLVKEVIERIPPPKRESGFYSRYFIDPKKDGGLRPIIDLQHLNRFLPSFTEVVPQVRFGGENQQLDC